MSATNSLENKVLLLYFNNSDAANIGDATGLRGSSTAGSVYVSLHTADPTEAGDQTSSECSYTGYGRVAVARTSGGWTVTDDSVSPVANIEFGIRTDAGATQTATHLGIGYASSGTGSLDFVFELDSSIAIDEDDLPRITTGTAFTVD